ACLIYFPDDVTFDQAAIEVTGSAAGNARAGLYAVGTDGLPGAQVHDFGEFDTSTTGTHTLTISDAVTMGWYYLAVVAGNAIAVHAASTRPALLGYTASNGTTAECTYFRSFTYAALPDPWGTPSGTL